MSSLRIFVSIVIIIIFFSCKKEVQVDQPLKDLLKSGGSWTISDFHDDLNTSINYTGTTLVFHTDEKMQLQSDTVSGNGTWRTSSVGDGVNGVSFVSIDLEGDDFLYLESKWAVLTMTNTQIELSSGMWMHYYMTIVKN